MKSNVPSTPCRPCMFLPFDTIFDTASRFSVSNGITRRHEATSCQCDCAMKSSEVTKRHETEKLVLDFQSSALPTELPSQSRVAY
jgi:hypothetical protein